MGKGQNKQARAAGGARPPISNCTAAGSGALSKTEPLLCTADLEAMDRGGLLGLWQNCFGGAAPKGMSLTFLRRFLAFDLQARSQGGLPAPLLAKLGRIDAGQERAATPTLKSGGRLLREWNGVTHVIDTTPEGYLWQGQHHRSLSAIARAITGAQWSGPRFFGLKAAETAAARKGHAATSTATATSAATAAARRKAGSR
jgi:hypothetical protein